MQITKYGNERKEEGFSYQSLADWNELQRVQDEFCAVMGIYAYCTDREGRQCTKAFGEQDFPRLIRLAGEHTIEQALLRVAEGSLEDYIVEDLPIPEIKLSVISIRIEGRTVVTWVVFGVLSDAAPDGGTKGIAGQFPYTVKKKSFYQALDLIRDVCFVMFKNKFSCVNAEAESLRSRFYIEEMKESADRIEAMAEVVQLLDSDDAIEKIMGKVLEIVGNRLKLSCGQVFHLYPETGKMDVVQEWCGSGIVSIFEKTRNIKGYDFLGAPKQIVAGSDVILSSPYSAEFEELGFKAVIVFPVMKGPDRSMSICFAQKQKSCVWKVEEVKFISDTVKVLQSILTRRIQKNSLAGSYVSLESILDNVGSCIYVKDVMTGEFLFANKVLKKTFARELKEGTMDRIIDSGKPMSLRHKGTCEIQYAERERWYDLLYTEIEWVDRRKVSLYSLYDITDKKKYQNKIEQQAYTDFLTGLYNRMCCERDLAWHIDDARKRSVQGGILYLDLDDFKHINDGLGHQYGDVLLKSISGGLQRVEGIRNSCYRMGGDEFVIIIPSDSFQHYKQIIEDIRHIFEKPWYLKDADYYCTMSMGVVTFPDDGDSVQDLIKKADIAMYEAKKLGKNRMARYSDSFGSISGRRLDMEKNMRDATAEGYRDFEVYYQPIIDIAGKGMPCTGAEALIRWHHPELGFIPPAEFIPLAEYLGLINPIGNHVLREACLTCRYWNDNGFPEYKVNVNLSVIQLLQSDIVEIIRDTVAETGIIPRNLTLEVTESLAINDMVRMKEILASIKGLGVRIALDDFGTGYSSLNHIREIPFDVIKVDQSFVKELAEDAYSQSFIKMVAELAATLGASICVEGIETEEQYRVLEGMKVRMVQGFYFDRAMPRKEFEKKYLGS